MNLDENLLDFLGKRHLLPTFNLPSDAVPFIVRTRNYGKEKILVNMSTGLEQALTQYGPGKELMVKKEEYVSHGLYLDFPPRPTQEEYAACASDEQRDQIRLNSVTNRFQRWFEEAEGIDNQNEYGDLSWLHMCDNINCRNTIDHPGPRENTPERFEIEEGCPLCKDGQFISTPLLRPPGFAPLINAERGDVQNPNSSESYQHVLSTRWPTQLADGDFSQEWTMLSRDENFKINFIKNARLVSINGGKESANNPELSGFTFCKDCGYLGTEDGGTPTTHHRPYAIVSRDGTGIRNRAFKTQFNRRMMSTCSPPEGQEDNRFKISTENRDYRRLFLGRRFNSDVIIFRIVWPKNAEMISFDNEENLQTGRIAATTLARALVRSFTEGGISGISVQSSDIGADVRMFVDGEDQGWDVFIYETADGGIGLLEAIFGRIMSCIAGGMEAKDLPGVKYAFEILEGRRCTTEIPDVDGNLHSINARPCDSICHGCLLDFGTQYMRDRLDREIGADLIRYGLYGLDDLKIERPSRTDTLVTLQRLIERKIEPQRIEIVPFDDEFQDFDGPQEIEFEEIESQNYEHLKVDNRHKIVVQSTLLCAQVDGSFDDGLTIPVTKLDLRRNPYSVLEKIKRRLTPRRRGRRGNRGR